MPRKSCQIQTLFIALLAASLLVSGAPIATASAAPASATSAASATTVPVVPLVDTTKTMTYAMMESSLISLQQRYPEFITLEIYGTSVYGRKLYAAKLTGPLGQEPSQDSPSTESTDAAFILPPDAGDIKRPAVLINAAHHGREWITTTLTLHMLEQYCQAYTEGTLIGGYDARQILDQSEIWFVPMVNPDGVAISQFGLRSVPKKQRKSVRAKNQRKSNYTRWKANGQGIDLNSQYDAAWKRVKSPKKPLYAFYKGKRPLQAQESRALVDLTLRVDAQLEVAYHSTGRVMYWGFQQTEPQRSRDLLLARQISAQTGYRIMTSTAAGAGGYTDWFSNKLKRSGFTLELTTGKQGYSNLKEFPKTWKENRAVGLFLAAEALKLGEATPGK